MRNSKFDSILPLLLLLVGLCYVNCASANEGEGTQMPPEESTQAHMADAPQKQANYALPDPKEDPKGWALTRLNRISGHTISGYFGGGEIPSIGESPWTKGDPGSGISWQLAYEWLPKNPAYMSVFGLPLTIGLGAMYTGYRSSGNDLADYNGRESNAHMSLLLNYLGVEGTLKLLTRSDRWTFNFRVSIGAMSSSFHGDVRSHSFHHEPFSFNTTKYGVAYAGRFNVDYNISRHVAVCIGVTSIDGIISKPLSHPDFDVYPEWPHQGSRYANRWLTLFNWTIGVNYHF